jgi:hypothetical protein
MSVFLYYHKANIMSTSQKDFFYSFVGTILVLQN